MHAFSSNCQDSLSRQPNVLDSSARMAGAHVTPDGRILKGFLKNAKSNIKFTTINGYVVTFYNCDIQGGRDTLPSGYVVQINSRPAQSGGEQFAFICSTGGSDFKPPPVRTLRR